jgi:hypothetical protein
VQAAKLVQGANIHPDSYVQVQHESVRRKRRARIQTVAPSHDEAKSKDPSGAAGGDEDVEREVAVVEKGGDAEQKQPPILQKDQHM